MKYLKNLWGLILGLFSKTVKNEPIEKRIRRAQAMQKISAAEKRLTLFDKIGYSREKPYRKVKAIHSKETHKKIFYLGDLGEWRIMHLVRNYLGHTVNNEKAIYSMARKIRTLKLRGVNFSGPRNKWGMKMISVLKPGLSS